MNQEILLETVELTRFYSQFCAVNKLQLTLNKGEVLGLLGPNGAGKSTTMQMLTGNLAPSEGTITVKQVDLLDNPKQAKAHIGYLPEHPPVYRDLTVQEYLMYCAGLKGVVKKKRLDTVLSACQRCDLLDVKHRLIGYLSKGFRQRVGIAQAILHSPSIIILDEPTVGLDPIQINEIRDLIKDLGQDHGVILSTHILPEVQAVCDRVQIMVKGQTVYNEALSEFSADNNQLLVECEHAIDIAQLEALDKVETVQVGINNQYEITFMDAINYVPDIMQLAVEQGWKLKKISPKQQTLEQTFIDLVHSDQQHSDEVEAE